MIKRFLLTLLILGICSTGWCATATWQDGGVDNNWSTAGNWDTAAKPQAGDDVVMAIAFDCVVDEATLNLKSLDMTGYTGTLSGTAAITVVGAASATDVIKFAGTITWAATLNLNPTAADTNLQLTSNGKTLYGITQNGNNAGDVYFIDNLTLSGGYVTLTNGNLHTDGAADNSGLTHNLVSMEGSAGNTIKWWLGNSTIGLTWRIQANNLAAAKVDAGTSSITIAPSGDYDLYLGYVAWYNLTLVSSTSGGNDIRQFSSAYNLTLTGGAGVGSDCIWRTTTGTVTNDLVIQGNSKTYPIMVHYQTFGTECTLTVGNSVTASNCLLRDIKGAGAASWDLSASVNVGDMSGNTDVTLTTADDWFWNGSGTQNFSDYTYWYDATNGGGSQMGSTVVPLPQDTCYFDANSIDASTRIEVDLDKLSGIDCTGASAFTFDPNGSKWYFGDLITGGATFAGTLGAVFSGDSANIADMDNQNLGSDGNVYIYMLGGSLTLASDFRHSAVGNGRRNYFTYGTFDAVSYNVSFGGSTYCDGSATRRVDMGTGTWTCGNGYNWAHGLTFSGSNLTLNCETSTLVLGTNNNSGSGYGLSSGGETFYDVTVSDATGNAIYGGGTFNTITIGTGKIANFGSGGSTYTISSIVTEGTGTQIYGGATFYLVDTAGTNTATSCTITNCDVSGGAYWDATDACTDGGGNSVPADGTDGWNFPAAGSRRILIISKLCEQITSTYKGML